MSHALHFLILMVASWPARIRSSPAHATLIAPAHARYAEPQASRFSQVAEGDAFPNTEVFVTDESGTARMVLTTHTTGCRLTGPLTNLPGDFARFMNVFLLGGWIR
jgi:hypothetical protein